MQKSVCLLISFGKLLITFDNFMQISKIRYNILVAERRRLTIYIKIYAGYDFFLGLKGFVEKYVDKLWKSLRRSGL